MVERFKHNNMRFMGETFRGFCEDVTEKGDGVFHIRGMTVFVPRVEKGVDCLVEIVEVHTNFCKGKLLRCYL